MFFRTKNRRAISTVLTTLIILVASVVLGTGVVLYGTSMFQTSAQSTSLNVPSSAVWADKGGSGWAWGAADVRNGGDKILSVDTITVRGQNIAFSNWYVDTNQTQVTTATFQQSLNYSGIISAQTGKMANYTGLANKLSTTTCPSTTAVPAFQENLLGTSATNPVLCLTAASGPISLAPGSSAIVYFKVPQNMLTTVDAGSSASVALYAGNVGAPSSVTVQSK